MTTVIVALGGSLLRPEIEERHSWLEELVSVIRDRVSMNDRIGIVVGGGAPAREGIELARPMITDESHLDKIGIAATRLNATIVRESLSDSGIPVSGYRFPDSGIPVSRFRRKPVSSFRVLAETWGHGSKLGAVRRLEAENRVNGKRKLGTTGS